MVRLKLRHADVIIRWSYKTLKLGRIAEVAFIYPFPISICVIYLFDV